MQAVQNKMLPRKPFSPSRMKRLKDKELSVHMGFRIILIFAESSLLLLSMRLDKFFQHDWHFSFVVDLLICYYSCRQTLERCELDPVDLAIRDHLEQVDGTLVAQVASVKVSSVSKQYFHNLEIEKSMNLCHGRFCFAFEVLSCFALSYVLNPEGTSDLLK